MNWLDWIAIGFMVFVYAAALDESIRRPAKKASSTIVAMFVVTALCALIIWRIAAP